MKNSWKTLIVLIALVSLAACTSTGNTGPNPADGMQVATLSGTPGTGQALLTATPLPNDNGPFILMQDDFSDPNSGWEIYSGDYGTAGYEQDGYVVEAIVKGEYNWGIAGVNFDNIRIDVDATAIVLPADAVDGFGVDCRLQDNGDGYGFRVSSDGYVAISLYKDGEASPLYEWTESNAVSPAGVTNHITAICQGTHFSLLVNDVLVAEAEDDTFASGDLSLSAISFSEDPSKVLFDDIVVQSIGDAYQYEDGTQYPVTLINASGREVCHVMISPEEEDFWGDSWLTGAQTFGEGDMLTFDDNTARVVDIEVLDCNDMRLMESYGINLAEVNSFTIAAPVVRAHYDFVSAEGWSQGTLADGSASITHNDYYSLSAPAGGAFVSGVVDFVAQDITLRADASLARTGDDGSAIYGVMCRVQNDGSGIFFALRSDGFGSIQKWQGGVLTPLTDWKASSGINTGIAANYIDADCVGDSFALYVNGIYVTEAETSEFPIGKVGVAAVPASAGLTQVDFDFVEILEPLE